MWRLTPLNQAARKNRSAYRPTLRRELPSPGWPARRRANRRFVLVAVVDAPTRDVIGRHLEGDSIAGEDADAVLPHLAACVSEDDRAVLQGDAKLRVRQHFLDSAFHLQHLFFGHTAKWARWRPVSRANCETPARRDARQ